MKNDIHVLDWGQIIDPSLAEVDKNKGILFEDLVEKLIGAMFPNEIWRRTQASYDGKKDFVYPYETFLKEQKWAECKNYIDNLSINVISPTLVMSSIENIEQIYFFSYSQLNNNAIDAILQFCNSSNKKITVYDGNLLEALICKYNDINGIKDFFPHTDFENAKSILNKKKLRTVFNIKNAKKQNITSNHVFELGETFNISVIVQNLCFSDEECKVHISSNQHIFLNTNTLHIYDKISFGEIKEFSVQCETIKSGRFQLKISLSTKTNNEYVFQSTSKKNIKISDDPFLFWTGEKAFNTRQRCIKHITSFNKTPLIICSPSGAGKSTLLNIITRDKTIANNYTTININLEFSRNYNTRSIFSQAIQIDDMDETPEEQKEEQNRIASILLNDYAQSASMIAINLMKLYNHQKPFLFVIDDIQKINRSYIDLLSEINSISARQNNPIYYVFALNTDCLSLDKLKVRLNWDENYGNNQCVEENLFYFDNIDIIGYLKHKFGLTGFENYFNEYDKELSPLTIQLFSSEIINNHIITLIPTLHKYKIVDEIKFSENVAKLLYSEYSDSLINNKLEGSDILEYLLKCICINTKIPLTLEDRYFNLVNQLIDSKILKEVNGYVIFYHEQIKKIIYEKMIFTEEDYTDIFYNNFTSLEGKVICAIQLIDKIFHASEFLNNYFINNTHVKKVEQLYDICFKIINNLEKFENHNLTTAALNFVYRNLNELSYELPQKNFYEFMKFIFVKIQTCHWDINDKCVYYIAQFIKRYFDRTLSTYNHINCYNDYISISKIFLNLKNISEEERNYYLCHYSNRAAIALDRQSDPMTDELTEVVELYNLSELYCTNAAHEDEVKLQIIVDNFNRKYIYHKNLSTEFINETLTSLLSLNIDNIDRTICLKYHILLLNYLNIVLDKSQNEINLQSLLQEIVSLRNESSSAFYNLKLYLMELYILIDLKLYTKAYTQLEEALNYSYLKGRRVSIYKLTYIKAFLLEHIDSVNKDEFIVNTTLAFEQFMDSKGGSDSNIKRESYLIYELLLKIKSFAPNYLTTYLTRHKGKHSIVLNEICNGDQNANFYKNNTSYFVYDKTNFPYI